MLTGFRVFSPKSLASLMAAVSGYVAFHLALSFSVPSTLPPALGWALFILYYHAYLLLAGRVFIGLLFRPQGEGPAGGTPPAASPVASPAVSAALAQAATYLVPRPLCPHPCTGQRRRAFVWHVASGPCTSELLGPWHLRLSVASIVWVALLPRVQAVLRDLPYFQWTHVHMVCHIPRASAPTPFLAPALSAPTQYAAVATVGGGTAIAHVIPTFTCS